MRFGSQSEKETGGGLRLIEQGTVQGNGTANLERFSPSGIYLLFLEQVTSGALIYQATWMLSAPQKARMETADILGSAIGETGSHAPTVTVGIGGIGITPYNSASVVQYALYRVR